MMHSFTAFWIKRNSHNAPDALSRSSVSGPKLEDMLAEYNDHSNLAMSGSTTQTIITSDSPTSARLEGSSRP